MLSRAVGRFVTTRKVPADVTLLRSRFLFLFSLKFLYETEHLYLRVTHFYVFQTFSFRPEIGSVRITRCC